MIKIDRTKTYITCQTSDGYNLYNKEGVEYIFGTLNDIRYKLDQSGGVTCLFVRSGEPWQVMCYFSDKNGNPVVKGELSILEERYLQ